MLTPPGSAVFAGGVLVEAGANVLSLLAANQLAATMADWRAYADSAEDQQLLGVYEEGRELYTLLRISSYASWGLGVAGRLLSYFVGTEWRLAISGFGQVFLSSLGYLAIAGGNVMALAAQTLRNTMEYQMETYERSGSDEGDEYERYAETERLNTLTSWLAYGLWGFGGLAIATAVLLPPGKEPPPVDAETPVALFVIPTNGGFIAGARASLR